jgi:hypothetical protein
MKPKFYSHIIEYNTVVIELEELDLTDKQREHLLGLIDVHIEHTILDTILSELSAHDQKIFLNNLLHDDHALIWMHLKERVSDIEQKIRQAAENLTHELIVDIAHAKEKNKV